MHGDLILGGSVYWFFVGILFLAAMLGAFVVIDSLRPKRRATVEAQRLREPLWTYTVGQGLYFGLMMLGQFPVMPRAFTGIVVLLTPFALAQSVAYLLRVVFPKVDGPPDEGAPEATAEAAPAYAESPSNDASSEDPPAS